MYFSGCECDDRICIRISSYANSSHKQEPGGWKWKQIYPNTPVGKFSLNVLILLQTWGISQGADSRRRNPDTLPSWKCTGMKETMSECLVCISMQIQTFSSSSFSVCSHLVNFIFITLVHIDISSSFLVDLDAVWLQILQQSFWQLRSWAFIQVILFVCKGKWSIFVSA